METQNGLNNQFGWIFWILWIFATAAGLVLGAMLEQALSIDLYVFYHFDSPVVNGTQGVHFIYSAKRLL